MANSSPKSVSADTTYRPDSRACSHHVEVGGAEQIQIADLNGIMSGVAHLLRYSARQRLVDEEPHPAAGSGSSRSSTAAAA
jgi:hypothetical protein